MDFPAELTPGPFGFPPAPDGLFATHPSITRLKLYELVWAECQALMLRLPKLPGFIKKSFVLKCLGNWKGCADLFVEPLDEIRGECG
jgi:hypothetical protein